MTTARSIPTRLRISTGAPDNLHGDFGYYVKPAAVGNFVWVDSNANGIQDAGEPGINGVRGDADGHVCRRSRDKHVQDRHRRRSEHRRRSRRAGTASATCCWTRTTATSTTGTPTASRAGLHHLGGPGPGCPEPAMRRPRPTSGANDLDDSDDFAGVDGLATQGSTDVTQNADPNRQRVRSHRRLRLRRDRDVKPGRHRQLRLGGRELGRLPGRGRAGPAQRRRSCSTTATALQKWRAPSPTATAATSSTTCRRATTTWTCWTAPVGRATPCPSGHDPDAAQHPARRGLRQPGPRHHPIPDNAASPATR